MMTVPSGMVMTRPLWWVNFIHRCADRWLRRHNPMTLRLRDELPSKLEAQTSLLDKIFPPPKG
jgi:hypothetical protein